MVLKWTPERERRARKRLGQRQQDVLNAQTPKRRKRAERAQAREIVRSWERCAKQEQREAQKSWLATADSGGDGCCEVFIIGIVATGLFLLGMIAIWNLAPVLAG